MRRVSAPPGHADRGDHLLGLEVGERPQRREVAAADAVGVGLGDLLDVDPAHVGEDQHRALARPVPGDARVVLLLDGDARVDQHAARHVAADLEREDRLGVGGGLVGRVGELDAARLHPPAGQDLRLDQRDHGVVERRRRRRARARSGRCRRSDSRPRSAAAPRRPAACSPCGRRRPRASPRGRSAPRGRRRARSPAPPRPPSPRRRGALTSARRSGRSQTRPCVRPVSAPIGFVAALKITLRHCAPRASATAVGRHPAARAGVGEPLDLLGARRARLERAERRVALARPTARRPARGSSRPGTSCRGSPARRARAITSSLPTPFWTDATAPSANACAVAAIAASVCIAFVATIPKSQAGSSAASLVARIRVACTSPAPVSRSPRSLIASTCACVEVVRPDLDVVERGEVGREERADRAAADDADPHCRPVLRGQRAARGRP